MDRRHQRGTRGTICLPLVPVLELYLSPGGSPVVTHVVSVPRINATDGVVITILYFEESSIFEVYPGGTGVYPVRSTFILVVLAYAQYFLISYWCYWGILSIFDVHTVYPEFSNFVLVVLEHTQLLHRLSFLSLFCA